MSNRIKREKPKPCPFCGGTDLKLTYTMIDGAKVHYVLCYECGAHGGIAMTEDFALTKWNTRRDNEAFQEVLDIIKKHRDGEEE